MLFGYSCRRITGNSMSPTMEDGDFVVVKAASSSDSYSIGEIVILKRLGEPVLIKRIKEKNGNDSYQLTGDNTASTPKIDLSNIKHNQIIAKAVFLIGKQGLKKL